MWLLLVCIFINIYIYVCVPIRLIFVPYDRPFLNIALFLLLCRQFVVRFSYFTKSIIISGSTKMMCSKSRIFILCEEYCSGVVVRGRLLIR